jgi:predicted TIM-barrel fold metal-dependent hydrolase
MIGHVPGGAMSLEADALRRIARIRAQLDHPIIDADGHLLESVPLLLEHVDALAGPTAAERVAAAIPTLFNGAGSAEQGIARGPWWPSVTDADYQAAVMVPALYAEVLERVGIDFAVVYPSLGLALVTHPDDDVRLPAVRALNGMLAQLFKPHAHRLTPAAVVPMHTPGEAIAELRHLRGELGLRAAMIPPAVARPLAAYPELFPRLCHPDRFGIDSAFDYDPVWRAFEQQGMAVTSHGAVGMRYLPDGRSSPTNYLANHALGHGYLQSELCRSLLFGGAPMRFPRLQFAFLEGGSAWAGWLLASLVEYWEKRGPAGLSNLDPARLDAARLAAILARHGFPTQPPEMIGDPRRAPWARNEFEASGLRGPEDLARIFGEQLAFGCESDDVSVPRALDGPGNKLGVALRPLFSSDIGHWDVPRLTDPLQCSWELVESGRLSRDGLRRFAFELPARVHLAMNPGFFAGTAVESAACALLG